MTPLADAVAGLKRNQLGLKFALEREVRLGMEAAATLAKSFIGEEQEGWDPLAASTIADKARQGYAVPAPLLRTGSLRDSLEAVAESVGDGVHGEIGTQNETAHFHEFGSSREPPRPFLGPAMMLTEPAIAKALEELALHILNPGSNL